MSALGRGTAIALFVAGTALGVGAGFVASGGPVWAEGEGSGGKQGSGQGGQGSQSGQGNQGGQGSGQGGPSADSDGKGPQAGGPSATGGGKPVWAQEGIPEVELGRLSVARSPAKVLDRSYTEALKSFTPEMADFYSQSLDDMIMAFSTEWDNLTIIDSPLQNLALLRDALDGSSSLTTVGVTNDLDTLMAVFIGVASDKTIPISTNTVIAVTTILGSPITGTAAEALAADAEAVRIAVLAGHG